MKSASNRLNRFYRYYTTIRKRLQGGFFETCSETTGARVSAVEMAADCRVHIHHRQSRRYVGPAGTKDDHGHPAVGFGEVAVL